MSLCYATIQRKILPQLAGLMTLEKQGLLRTGTLVIRLDFDDDTIHDAVRAIAEAHGFEHNGSSLYVAATKVTFIPNN